MRIAGSSPAKQSYLPVSRKPISAGAVGANLWAHMYHGGEELLQCSCGDFEHLWVHVIARELGCSPGSDKSGLLGSNPRRATFLPE